MIRKLILSILVMLVTFTTNSWAYVRYVTENLNLRYGPGTNYGVITTLPKGTPVEIDEDCDCKWVPVSYLGYIGYISTKYLSKSSSIKKYNESRPRTYSRNTPYSSYGRRVRYYTNTDGYKVQSPTYYHSTPTGASALCRDGTYSFSRNRRGTCSHHGGVARWL